MAVLHMAILCSASYVFFFFVLNRKTWANRTGMAGVSFIS